MEHFLNPIDFECYQYVSGIVTDKKSGALLPNSLVFVYDENNKELYTNLKKLDDADRL